MRALSPSNRTTSQTRAAISIPRPPPGARKSVRKMGSRTVEGERLREGDEKAVSETVGGEFGVVERAGM